MSLPKSLGTPGVSAEQLLAESLALKDPYGIPLLQIQPAAYERLAADGDVLTSAVRDNIRDFFASTAAGDAEKAAALNAAFFDGNEVKRGYQYLLSRTAASAADPAYGDAHAGCVKMPGDDAAPLAGIVVMPRTDQSFGQIAANMTGLPAEQFGAAPVPLEQLRFLTLWHEFAHTLNADEPQADKMAAVVARKAFGTDVLQVYADMRVIDSLFDYKSKGDDATGRPARQQIYGLRTAEAVDAVIAMPDGKIEALDEKSLAGFAKEPLGHVNQDALRRVGALLAERDPAVVDLKQADLGKTGTALQDLLRSRALDDDPAARAVAGRSLQAIQRLALNAPAPDADIDLGRTAHAVAAVTVSPTAAAPRLSAFAAPVVKT